MTDKELIKRVMDWFLDLSAGRHTFPKEGVPTTEELAEWRANEIIPIIKKQVAEEIKGELEELISTSAFTDLLYREWWCNFWERRVK